MYVTSDNGSGIQHGEIPGGEKCRENGFRSFPQLCKTHSEQILSHIKCNFLAIMTLNFQKQIQGSMMHKYVQYIRRHPEYPLMAMEFWTGWYDHWGGKHEVFPLEGKCMCLRPGREQFFIHVTLSVEYFEIYPIQNIDNFMVFEFCQNSRKFWRG